MLLPSAITCDSSNSSQQKSYFPPTTLFASPPISPPATSHSHTSPNTNTTISSLYSTCRALQSMLSPAPTQLPSPPTQHMETPLISSPFKLRLRNRGIKSEDSHLSPRKKITKRTTTTVPRGVNKRRRALDDDLSRESVEQSPEPSETEEEEKENMVNLSRGEEEEEQTGPRTPKRLRLAPEILPLGLERSDFHALHLQHQNSSQPLFYPSSSSQPFSSPHQYEYQQRQQEDEERNEEWTTEDDRLLVELVLEKLKLSKSEWQDCARSLGKDRGSVGKRWKSLMAGGDIGLKGKLRNGGTNAKRRGIYGSWR